MMKEMKPDLGFQSGAERNPVELASKLENIGVAAVRRRYSPEFVNRIDVVITYQPLDEHALAAILDQHIGDLQKHVNTRLGSRSFEIEVDAATKKFLLERGTSAEYGARELKAPPPAPDAAAGRAVAKGDVEPGAQVMVAGSKAPRASRSRRARAPRTGPAEPIVMVVDDNQGLLTWLEQELKAAGFQPVVFARAPGRDAGVEKIRPDAGDRLMLPDGTACTSRCSSASACAAAVVVMSGMASTPRKRRFATATASDAYKPFLSQISRACCTPPAARRLRAREVSRDLAGTFSCP